MALVNLWMASLNRNIDDHWFSYPSLYLAPVPVVTALVAIQLWFAVKRNCGTAFSLSPYGPEDTWCAPT